MVCVSHPDVTGDRVVRSVRVMPSDIRIGSRRIRFVPVAIALLCLVSALVGVLLVASHDGRSKTERVSDCLVAAGYAVQVYRDDGKEPIGGDEGLLGPLGDYRARPPSDAITVTRLHTGTHVADVFVQSGSAHVGFNGARPERAQIIDACTR